MTIYNHTNTASAGDVVRSEDWNADHIATAETNYWSATGTNFKLPSSTMAWFADEERFTNNSGAVKNAFRTVELPQGAIVTKAICYGTGNSWGLRRELLGGGAVENIAAAAMGVEDTSILNATIDNENYKYHIITSLDDGETITGVKITYTI